MRAAAGGVAGIAIYSGEIERHWLETTHYEVKLPGLAHEFDGFRIAQVSDIHLDEFTEPFFARDVVRRVNQLRPDAIVLTGDFVSSGPCSAKFARGAAWQCADILKGLECRARYTILGNHDVSVGEKQVSRALTENGMTVLKNRSLPVERGRARIWIAGLDDVLHGRPDPELAVPASVRRSGEPVILLCHEPDYVDQLLQLPVSQAVGLMISGHTHGGQVRVPFLPPIYLPPLGQRYVEGWFRFGGMQLYVNRGVGTVGAPFRLGCPPELTVFTLRA